MTLGRWRTLAVAAPHGDSLRVVRLRRRGTSVTVAGICHLPLRADITTDDPEVVARGLRDHLREQGVRERKWVFAVPPEWLVSRHILMPELLPEDEESFLWLQVEQGMPVKPDEAALAVSRYALPQGKRGATLFAMNRARLKHISRVFEAAGLDLLGAAPGLVRASSPASSGVDAVLCLRTTGALLQVNVGGGPIMLRGVDMADPGDRHGLGESLRQPVRLALAALPDDVREQLTELTVLDEIRDEATVAAEWNGGLSGATGTAIPVMRPADGSGDDPYSIPDAAAVMALEDNALSPFAPRKAVVTVSSANIRLVRLGVLLALACVACALLIAVQVRREAALKHELALLGPTVATVAAAHEQVTSLAPWFDCMPRSLELLRGVAQKFPERGTVWVNRVTVVDGVSAKIDGYATDPGAWLAMQEAIRKSPDIRDFRVVHTRAGTTKDRALAFAATFTWRGGGRP